MDITQFAHAISIGLGRPIHYLRAHDSRPYRDVILDACLRDMVYDRQCEGSRAPYLFDVIAATGEPNYYRDCLLRANTPETLDGDDGEQIVAILGQFARTGDTVARAQIRAIFAANAAGRRPDGASELVAAEGIAGLLTVAAHLPIDPDDQWFAAMLVNGTVEIAGEAATWAALRERATDDPDVAAFIAAVEQEAEHRIAPVAIKQRKQRPAASYRTIRAAIAAGERDIIRTIRRWRRDATAHDLIAAARDVQHELDPARLKLLLLIFAERPFPLDHRRLLALARDRDERLTHSALMALENVTHPDVRVLGLTLLGEGNGNGACLLANNYRDGDFTLIERLLNIWTARDALHALGLGLRAMVEAQPISAATAALLAIYEVGPCALCRHGVVALLRQLDTTPDWLDAEYEHDSYGQTMD